MSRKRVQLADMPASEIQWRARKIAMQASSLADRARPMTRKAALTARRQADIAAGWTKPRVDSARGWMAVRAARGSVSMQDTVGPRMAAMLATAAKKLEPPRRRSRMMPMMVAGMAVLAAGAAAVTAIAIRNRNAMRSMAMPPGAPAAPADQSEMPSPESAEPRTDADFDGLSRIPGHG